MSKDIIWSIGVQPQLFRPSPPLTAVLASRVPGGVRRRCAKVEAGMTLPGPR